MKIALQLYSLRDMAEEDFLGTVKRVAEMGFDGIEFAGYFNTEADVLKARMDELGLEAMGAHLGINLLTSDYDKTVAYSKALGEKYLTCPGLPGEYTNSKEAWLSTAKLFQEIGKKLNDEGMVFSFHNHSSEFDKHDGETGIDILYSNSDPKFVHFEMDVCWVENAGYDSVELMKKYPEATKLLHIKELAKSGDPHERVIIGEGKVDMKAVVNYGKELGCEWLVIEHETTEGDLIEDITAGLNYLKTLI